MSIFMSSASWRQIFRWQSSSGCVSFAKDTWVLVVFLAAVVDGWFHAPAAVLKAENEGNHEESVESYKLEQLSSRGAIIKEAEGAFLFFMS